MQKEIVRCGWATKDKKMQEYHDTIWGIPVHDDPTLFKMLILEGKQAGLSWSTILNKMDTLCVAFDDFRPEIVVNYNDKKIEELLKTDGIIKNRAKINAVINNAKAYYRLCEKYNSLNDFLCKYTDFQTIDNAWHDASQIPTHSEISDAISKELKALGFKFVGSITVYAFMQAVGMVNDHVYDCSFRHA